MDVLTLNPPLLIITMGYPGAGKTFFSRQFADKYSLSCFSEDRIRFELFENPQFNTDESEIIGRILDYSIVQAMKTGSSIVLDGNFSDKAARKRLYEIAKDNKYRTLVVWLQTDINTSRARAARRDRRNPDSKYSFNISTPQFDSIIKQLERPSEKEQFVVISGKHAFKGQALTVLRKIAETYANSLDASRSASKAATGAPTSVNHRNLIQ